MAVIAGIATENVVSWLACLDAVVVAGDTVAQNLQMIDSRYWGERRDCMAVLAYIRR